MNSNRIGTVPVKMYFLIIIMLVVSASCVNTKKAIYFPDQNNAVIASTSVVAETKIQSNDLLSISVNSMDKEATELFNSFNLSGTSFSSSAGNTTQVNGYLVNAEGNINVPFLGTIKAAGLTETQLANNIRQGLLEKKLMIDPVVNVHHLNFKITVLGEVAHPTVITVPSGKISLLEALGLAGDLTIYARRDNVLLIREQKGEKTTTRINLNSSELLTSPYYYLHSNDVVYVEPNKARISASGRVQQLLPAILSGLSFIAIVIDRVTR